MRARLTASVLLMLGLMVALSGAYLAMHATAVHAAWVPFIRLLSSLLALGRWVL